MSNPANDWDVPAGYKLYFTGFHPIQLENKYILYILYRLYILYWVPSYPVGEQVETSGIWKNYFYNISIFYNFQFSSRKRNSNKKLRMKMKCCRFDTPEGTLTPVDLNLINDLWVPNVFIYNLKSFQVIFSVGSKLQWR